MKPMILRCCTLAMLAALSSPALAIEPFAPLPDLEALPDLDTAPPRKLHADEPSWGSPVNRDGSPVASGNQPATSDGFNSQTGTDGANSQSEAGGRNSASAGGLNSASQGGGLNSESGSGGLNSESGSGMNSQSGGGLNSASQGSGLNSESGSDGLNSESQGGGLNSESGSGSNSESHVGGLNSASASGSNSESQGGGLNSASGSGLNSQSGSSGSNTHSNNDNYPPLTKIDEAMQPNLKPTGMPVMPSQCAEDKACRPCFDDANANLDIRRRNLEKVRAIHTYTHRFAQDGKDLMNGVGALAGGAPAVEAAVQSRSVDQSLDAFDETVRTKNAELLGKLQNDLHELAACEAKYFGNNDWYPRYGELYYQFMQARYTL